MGLSAEQYVSESLEEFRVAVRATEDADTPSRSLGWAASQGRF
jgi:hypothetical protein